MEEIANVIAQPGVPLQYQLVSYRLYWRSPLTHLHVQGQSWDRMEGEPVLDESGSDTDNDVDMKDAGGSLDLLRQRYSHLHNQLSVQGGCWLGVPGNPWLSG
jgi:hypothetical protein